MKTLYLRNVVKEDTLLKKKIKLQNNFLPSLIASFTTGFQELPEEPSFNYLELCLI